MIGPFEENSIQCVDAYEAIKRIPDKSIDCIYTDINSRERFRLLNHSRDCTALRYPVRRGNSDKFRNAGVAQQAEQLICNQ